MRRVPAGLAGLALATGVAATVALSASAAPPDGSKGAAARHNVSDDLPDRAEEKRRALRKAGLQEVLNGTAKVEQRGASKVVKVGETAAPGKGARAKAETEDQYVELGREKTDKIFVILAEFGNKRHPSYPDQDTNPAIPGPARFDGPLHDQIPEPDRSKDNSTIWQPDYPRSHYEQLYFGAGADVESLKTYYERQSSGRYSVDGQVTDWVKVRYNEARYGRSNGYPCAGNVCTATTYAADPRRRQRVGRRPGGGGAHRRADRARTSPTTTSGIATTSTATATSTSPTATSTTSRSSTPAATRPTATRARVRTPSGRIARRSPSRRRQRGPGRTTRTAARRSATPACGWPTTRSSRRTAACRSSPTSTRTTSGCPTSTTRPPRRQRRQLVVADGAEPRLRDR